MISLVLRGKSPLSEDALTAALLDIFRHHAAHDLLSRIVAAARPLVTGHVLPQFDSFDLELWPLLDGREPDARLRLKRGGREVCRLLIESKIGAPKTGAGDVDEKGNGDQLAAYLLSQVRLAPETPAFLLYLTHHAACPAADLEESARALCARGRDDLLKALFWLSWRDVEGLLGRSEPSQACRDVAELLRRLKLYRFTHFETRERLALDAGPLEYRSARYQRSRTSSAVYLWGDARFVPLPDSAWTYASGRSRRYDWPAKLPASHFFSWNYDVRRMT